MGDDKSKVGKQDRTKVAGDQDYEVQHFAQQHNLSPDQVRELISMHGNDRGKLEQEARKLSAR